MKRIPLMPAIYLTAFLVLLAGLAGCGTPEEKPLPDESSEYKYQEPVITLYDNDTGEKRRSRWRSILPV
jgi:stage II sporulation protein D